MLLFVLLLLFIVVIVCFIVVIVCFIVVVCFSVIVCFVCRKIKSNHLKKEKLNFLKRILRN